MTAREAASNEAGTVAQLVPGGSCWYHNPLETTGGGWHVARGIYQKKSCKSALKPRVSAAF